MVAGPVMKQLDIAAVFAGAACAARLTAINIPAGDRANARHPIDHLASQHQIYRPARMMPPCGNQPVKVSPFAVEQGQNGVTVARRKPQQSRKRHPHPRQSQQTPTRKTGATS